MDSIVQSIIDAYSFCFYKAKGKKNSNAKTFLLFIQIHHRTPLNAKWVDSVNDKIWIFDF